MKETQTNFELYEPSSPEALVPDSWIEPWMMVTLAILLLAAAAFFIFRKKKHTPFNPLAARKAAFEEALAGLELIHAPTTQESSVQSSLVLRKYLSVTARDPALFETHEEFISRRDSLGILTDDARLATEAGFARLATTKYARESPVEDPLEIVRESRILLETLNQGFRA
jgi:LPXTG-motif cell wall-anchored protein